MQIEPDHFGVTYGWSAIPWRWLRRVALGATGVTTSVWLLAPGIRTLLQSDPVRTMDTQLATWLQAGMTSQAFAQMMGWLSLFHGTAGILVMTALAAAALWQIEERERLPVLGVTVLGGMLLNVAVKHVVHRARPDWGHAPLEALESFSFPSGHTAGATVFYGVVVAWLWPRLGSAWVRTGLLLAALTMMLLVATSRIARGMHFPSDCIAALLEMSVWLTVCLAGILPRHASLLSIHHPP